MEDVSLPAKVRHYAWSTWTRVAKKHVEQRSLWTRLIEMTHTEAARDAERQVSTAKEIFDTLRFFLRADPDEHRGGAGSVLPPHAGIWWTPPRAAMSPWACLLNYARFALARPERRPDGAA
ncbi:unnamed protein product, partial [Amoebophrya sp. A120]|eukprot:GSA120T00003646001.1